MSPVQEPGPFEKGVRRMLKGSANKVKKLTEPAQFDITRFFRWVLVLILYLVTFSALDQMASCEQCADLFADLGAISAATAALPVPLSLAATAKPATPLPT